MGIETAKNGKLIYHLTRLSNLPSILENGLISRKAMQDSNLKFSDVADQEIVTKRKRLGLDKYVPFHFHPYSSFDVAVKKTHSYAEFIYICVHRDVAKHNEYRILIKHPLSVSDCVLHNYDEGMKLIDWNTLMETGRTDDYAKHVKMAECLSEMLITIEQFHMIAVKDSEIKKEVEAIFDSYRLEFPPPFVDVHKWF